MKKFHTEKLIRHLEEKWGEDKPCPMCGGKNWLVGDIVYNVRGISGNNDMIFPILPVMCQKCGNTIFINELFLEGIKEKQIENKEEDI